MAADSTDLIEAMSRSLGLPAVSLAGYLRHLAEAGLRTKGGRGRHGASMSPRDAAYLLTAILGGGQVKDAALTVKRYLATLPHADTSSTGGFRGLGIAELKRLPLRHSFPQALEAVIASAASGSLMRASALRAGKETLPGSPMIEVMALSPGTLGDLRLSGINGKTASVRYWTPPGKRSKPEAWQARIPVEARTDLQQYRKVSEATVLAIGQLLTRETSSDD